MIWAKPKGAAFRLHRPPHIAARHRTADMCRATYPLSGHLFCFVNGRRNRMKVLVWEPSGFLLVYKRLERGRFRFPLEALPGQRHIEMGATDLALMMEGIDLRGARRRPHWAPATTVDAKRLFEN